MTKAAAVADTPTTMVEVEELTNRATSLERQARELGEQEQKLTKKIAEHHAGGKQGKGLDALTQERRAVREQRADILEGLPLLRARIDTDREQACTVAAGERMTGIGRAYENVRAELDDDVGRAQKAAAGYRDAVASVNDRYKALVFLLAETNALGDRFAAVAVPSCTPVVLPAMREGCREAVMTVQSLSFLDHLHLRPETERDEHGLRQRRTYEEVASTPSGEILRAAGPKPFPPLTSRQEEMVASRARAKETEVAAASQFAGEASRTLQRRSL